jgi:hypothetical protein
MSVKLSYDYRIVDRRQLDHLRAAPRTQKRISLAKPFADATGRRAVWLI